MWRWKALGALGTAAGSGYFVSDHRVLHASGPVDAVDPPGKPTGSRVRQHMPVFDTNASEIRETYGGDIKPRLEELELRNVQVFFRHGARTPLRILTWLDQPEWPKDKILGDPPFPGVRFELLDVRGQAVPTGPYEQMYQKIIFKGGTPAGQLTKTGKTQVYELGKRLREDYVEKQKLIKPIFNPSQVYVRSTNMMRTIESARWLLSGLFGDNRRVPITIFTEPAEREILYPNHSFCLQLKIANKKLFKGIDRIPGLRDDRMQLQKLLGYDEEANGKKKLNYVDLRDEIVARQAHGITVPENALAVMNEIELYAVRMLTFMVSGSYKYLRKDILRLACGPVFHLIRENIDSAVREDGFYKLQLYSCHDSMLMALLVTLGVFNGKWPPFAADLTFETYEDSDGDEWIRVMYMGKPLTLPNSEHGELISLDRFSALITPYVVTAENYREECQAATEDVDVDGESLDVIGGGDATTKK